jgi:hypothetical protein
MEFNYNVDRDAYATIAGFVLQVDLTALRWLNLDDLETLELECGEDIDTVGRDIRASVSQGTRLFEQVKRRQANITLRSPISLEALANFADHRATNPEWRLRFRLLTTAKIGREQHWQGDLEGIALWEAIRSGDLSEEARKAAVQQIRALLQESAAPVRISAGTWQILQAVVQSNAQFDDFVDDFEWSTNADDYVAVEGRTRIGLIQAGFAADDEQAGALSDRLFAFLFRTLSQAGPKLLTRAQLLAEVSRSTQSQADLQMVAFIRSELVELGARMAKAEGRISTLENVSTTTQVALASLAGQVSAIVEFVQPSFVADVPDMVSPSIPRLNTVGLVLEAFERTTAICLIGEPGAGKTQLSLLIGNSSPRPLVWVDVPRGATPAQACFAIDSTLRMVSGGQSGPVLSKMYEEISVSLQGSLVVLDNLPRFLPGDPLARRIELLSRYLGSANGKLLTTSYYPFPKRTSEQAAVEEIQAPRFDEGETPELLVAYGAPTVLASKLTTLIHTATQGLPALVTAVARYLASKGWLFDANEFEAIVKAEFAHAERTDARELLRLTIPDEGTRELLYRLTLVIGGISREEVERVARVKSPISLPLEKMERLTGLWLQPFVGDKYTISPLIDPAVSNLLEERTRRGVYTVLALSIMARGTIYPLDAVTCIHYFTLAGLFGEAAFMLASALTALIDAEPDLIEDSMVLASVWIAEIPDQIDINLKLHIRGLQIVATDNRGRSIDFLLSRLDQELDSGGVNTWGGAIASSFLAIRFCKKHPAIANRYLLKYLQRPASVVFPDGKQVSMGETSLIGILWATAQYAGSDEEVESWIGTVEQLTPQQIEELDASPFKEDSASVLCDGIWLRDYRKAPGDRDWSRVEALVLRVEAVGTQRGLKTLAASAIRTRIMILAEWRHDMNAAVQLALSSLPQFNSEGDAFLITEVTGRQLAYAGRKSEAIEWLERAHAYTISEHEVWRRNVMITLAEFLGKEDPAKAVALTHEAVLLSRTVLLGERLAESCAEETIARWNANDRKGAFDSLQLAVRETLTAESDAITWKELFLSLFRVAIYFGSIAHKSRPPVNINAPTQGMFLGTDGLDTTKFYPAQKSYIQIWMAMFGEGLREYSAAEVWLQGAMQLAETYPVARSIYTYAGFWVAYPLRRNDFRAAVRLTVLMADANPDSAARSDQAGDSVQQFAVPKELTAAQGPFAVIIGLVPAALRLAFLRLLGSSDEDLASQIGAIEDGLAGRPEANLVSHALRDAVLSAMTSTDCYVRAGQFIPSMGTAAAGMIYMVGSALKARVPDALVSQTWLAQNLERFFAEYPSVQDELLVPFLETYWRRQVIANGHEFRSGASFTLRMINESGRSASGSRTKALLRSMDSCIPTALSNGSRSWLSL